MLALSIRTIVRNNDWQSELTLWEKTVVTAPNSFKSHSALAEALYDADPTRASFERIIAEGTGLALLADIPHPEETSQPYRQAAAYYLEHGDLLKARNDTDGARRSFERAVVLTNRFLQLISIRPTTEQDRTTAQLMLANRAGAAAKQRRGGGTRQRCTGARAVQSNRVRSSASALLSARQPDAAAVTLMTGFMVTGRVELREAMLELYRTGLDTEGCAFKQTPNGLMLNDGCAIVERHLRAASAEAIRVQRAAGRADLAVQLERSTAAGCRQPSVEAGFSRRFRSG